jgi:hypothetical protein
MAKRLVALVAVAAPVLAIGGVAFAQLASHSAVTAAAAVYTGSAVSHDIGAIRAGDSLALELPAALPAPADLAPAQSIADVSFTQSQAFKLALLDTVAQTTDASGTSGSTNVQDQIDAKALAQKINDALSMLPDNATQDQVNAAIASAVSGVSNPVVLTAALAVVQKNDNSPAVTAAVAAVKSSPTIAPILSTMTTTQQNVALTITAAVAPTVNTVAIAFNSGTTGTTSGGAVITTSGPSNSGLSNTASGYTGA